MPPNLTADAHISLDTNIIGEVAHSTTTGHEYLELLSGAQTVVTFFVQAEVLANDWPPEIVHAAEDLMSTAILLLSPSISTIRDYVHLKRISVGLGLHYGVEREDLWMLAQTRAEGLDVMTHDRAAARVAHGASMNVFTAHKDLEADYFRDRQRLRRLGLF